MLCCATACAAPLCPPALRVANDAFGGYLFAADGGLIGIDVDLLGEIGRRLGCEVPLEVESTVRILHRIEQGTADVSGHKAITDTRLKTAWMVPYMSTKMYAVVRRSAGVDGWSAFLANPALRVAIGRAYAHGPAYDRLVATLRAQGRVVDVADVDELYRMLRIGRVQAIFSSPPVYRRILRGDELGASYAVQDWMPAESATPVYLMLSKRRFSREQAQRVADIVGQMRRDGTLVRIVAKYEGWNDARAMMLAGDPAVR